MAEPDHTTQEQVYWTREEVASLLRVEVRSLDRWRKKDPTLPALKIGGKAGTVLFHRERLMAWLRSREQGRGRAKRSSKLLTHVS